MKALYLYPLWVRIWHWSNAVLFLLLILSGASLHFAGGAWLLPFEAAVTLHNGSGILLTLGWVVFLLGNLFTDHGRFYRVRFAELPGALRRQVGWYAVGLFRGDPHPFHPSADDKLNALQKLTYLGLMLALMPLLIGSGWIFLFAGGLPSTLLGLPSLWAVAGLHLTLAWAAVLFLVVHVYVITIGDSPWTNLRAMWTGWHRPEPKTPPPGNEPGSEASAS